MQHFPASFGEKFYFLLTERDLLSCFLFSKSALLAVDYCLKSDPQMCLHRGVSYRTNWFLPAV